MAGPSAVRYGNSRSSTGSAPEAARSRGAIPRWAVPVGVRFVESIDKTSVGKVDKKLLRAKYAAEGRPTGEVHA